MQFPPEATGALPGEHVGEALWQSHLLLQQYKHGTFILKWKLEQLKNKSNGEKHLAGDHVVVSKHNILCPLNAVESPLELEMQLILIDEFHCFLLKNFRYCICCVCF